MLWDKYELQQITSNWEISCLKIRQGLWFHRLVANGLRSVVSKLGEPGVNNLGSREQVA